MRTADHEDFLDDLFAVEPLDAGLLRTLARRIPRKDEWPAQSLNGCRSGGGRWINGTFGALPNRDFPGRAVYRMVVQGWRYT